MYGRYFSNFRQFLGNLNHQYDIIKRPQIMKEFLIKIDPTARLMNKRMKHTYYKNNHKEVHYYFKHTNINALRPTHKNNNNVRTCCSNIKQIQTKKKRQTCTKLLCIVLNHYFNLNPDINIYYTVIQCRKVPCTRNRLHYRYI